MWGSFQSFYRQYLYGVGEETVAESAREKGRRGSKARAVAKVTRQEGHLSVSQVLRVRYFAEGVAFGSQAWLEALFAQNREKLQVRRRTGARKLKTPGLEK